METGHRKKAVGIGRYAPSFESIAAGQDIFPDSRWVFSVSGPGSAHFGRVYEKGATGAFVTTTGDAHGSNRFEIQMEQAKLLVKQDQLFLEEFSMPEPEWSAVNREPFASMPSTKTVVETDGQNPQHNGVIIAWGGAILRGGAAGGRRP